MRPYKGTGTLPGARSPTSRPGWSATCASRRTSSSRGTSRRWTTGGTVGPEHPIKVAKQVSGDHTILTRTLRAAQGILDEATGDSAAVRRAVLERLEVFSRLKGVLEHHTRREQRDFYPVLDDALSAEERARWARLLAEAVAPR